MVNNVNKFEEDVMFMLKPELRFKLSSLIDKGAKWVICDEGICLMNGTVLVLRITESFYKNSQIAVL